MTISLINTDHFSGQAKVTPSPLSTDRDLAVLIREIQTESNTNESDIGTVAGDLATTAGDLATTAGDVLTAQGDITDLQNDMAVVKNNRVAITVADTPYTVAAGVNLVGVDTTGGAVEVILPDPATLDEGQEICVKDEGGNAAVANITVTGAIDGAAAATIAVAYEAVTVYSDHVAAYFTK